jgi:hypothetical protein
MNVREGDRVAVNIAPFIGSASRSEQTVPCIVLAVRAAEVQVCPQPPFREIALWVHTDWIESRPARKPELVKV